MEKILISMLAVAALVSCSKEESIRVDQGELIGFGNAFVDNSTRATDPSYGTANPLTSFQVWGTINGGNGAVAIFANDTVEGTVGTGSTWNCTTKTQYWVNGAKYNFAALANAGTVTLGADLLPATVAFESNGSTDLIYAKSAEYTGQPAGQNVKVAFTFEHLLSKVNFTVNNGSQTATGYSFLVRDIKIAGATAGTCDVTTTTWTATASNGYTIADITVDNDTASADCGTALLVIPGKVTVSFNVDILVDGVTLGTKEYTSAVTTLAPANSYNFVVTPTVGEEIKFTVANDPTWTTQTDVTVQ